MKKNILKSTCAALAAVVMVSGFWYASQKETENTVPELVSYIDTLEDDGIVTIESEEVPLSSKPVVQTKTSTQTSTKKTKLKKKSTKTSTTTKRSTKKSSSVKTTSTQKIATATTVLTTEKTSLKKNSNVKTVKTTVKTTVTTTTTTIASANKTNGTAVNTAGTSNASKATVAIRSIAPKAHANVLSAYEKMNFTVTVDPSVSYSGKFDAKTQSITVRKNSDEAVYHELGHFVAFTAGNVDKTAEFKTIYANEKSKFVATRGNASYITSSAEEYFAESYQDYVENPTALKSARPQTYAYIVNAVSKITDAKATQLKQLYASIWK